MIDDTRRHRGASCTDVDALDQGYLQTARSLAAGIVCGGVIHEFANLLTIIDGQRQMEQLGLLGLKDGAPGVDTVRLLAKPARRCQQLLEAFQHVFSDLPSDLQELPLTQELTSLEVLLRVRLRGRPTRIEILSAGSSLLLPGRGSVAVRLAFLLGLLSILEHGRAGEEYPERIALGGEGTESSCRSLSARVTRFRSAPEDHASRAAAERLLETAHDLIRRFGGRLSLEETPDRTATLRVHVPA